MVDEDIMTVEEAKADILRVLAEKKAGLSAPGTETDTE